MCPVCSPRSLDPSFRGPWVIESSRSPPHSQRGPRPSKAGVLLALSPVVGTVDRGSRLATNASAILIDSESNE
jgi:hypothetical protein